MLVIIFVYLCLYMYVLIDAIYTFFRCFLSLYTQYLWPISPTQCFYGPLYTSTHGNVVPAWL